MNEADTRALHIDPALAAAGWGQVAGSRVLREHVIKPGRLLGAGQRGEPTIADYVLVYRNTKLATLEAKAWDKPLTEGRAQAVRDAGLLGLRHALCSNGQGLYGVDLKTGHEGERATYPTPDELWAATFAEANAWRDRFAAVPLEDKSGSWTIRYYQELAVNAVLDAVSQGHDRILLTLATGTGKTSIAFQIAWKLFHSRWNLNDWRDASNEEAVGTRRPRILFLADRNILANQANNDFSAFDEDARVRIEPDAIKKKGRVPTNASVFFTIFQTFMSGPDESPYFGDYAPDFFDLIIIDECHRGGARDESTWRAILEHFSPAVQLGLTATPKREHNADTYAYFGEPVYTYSLKDGINDGFLTPFRVQQYATTIDDYVYTPDDDIVSGTVEPGKRYEEKHFNRSIEIAAREAYRVDTVMARIPPGEKTIVFCATQDHALQVRDLINQYKARHGLSTDPLYCVRVTANDGAIGDQHLKDFQDNDKTIPAILTTSQKLSTGVDARNVRHIVLLRPINSMIEFKQIIGRGTRVFDGKEFCTVHDFVKAHHLFSDPAWDGEPLAPEGDGASKPYPPQPPAEPGRAKESGVDEDEGQRPQKLVIRLADGKTRALQHISVTTYWGPDGKPMSAAQFLESLYGKLPEFFKDEDELRRLWADPTTRRALRHGLKEQGFDDEKLRAMQQLIDAPHSDLFDVLAYVAFATAPRTRSERAAQADAHIATGYDDKQRAFLRFVLDRYVRDGVNELDGDKLVPLLTLRYGNTQDALKDLGAVNTIRDNFVGFQRGLYEDNWQPAE